MKRQFFYVMVASLNLTSCATEHYFNVGIGIPSGFSFHARKSLARSKKKCAYDVIIVPGVPYDPDHVSSIMKIRILWAKYLFDQGYTRNIIFSGSSVYTPYVEGAAMKIIADSMGIPADRTFIESTAEHSTENIYYSWKMARKMGFKKIALATDPFQSLSLRAFIRKYCPDVESVPVVFDQINFYESTLPKIDLTHVSVSDFVSLVKRKSFRQRFAGTRGQRVKDELKREELKLVQTD